MTRLVLFAVIFGMIVYYFTRGSVPRAKAERTVPAKPKKGIFQKKIVTTEFWTQVFDTDSDIEARAVQAKFLDMGIHCVVYEQGHKDVYGGILKHYGLSVPRDLVDKAQSILAETTL
jgi:hypothetical protein